MSLNRVTGYTTGRHGNKMNIGLWILKYGVFFREPLRQILPLKSVHTASQVSADQRVAEDYPLRVFFQRMKEG